MRLTKQRCQDDIPAQRCSTMTSASMQRFRFCSSTTIAHSGALADGRSVCPGYLELLILKTRSKKYSSRGIKRPARPWRPFGEVLAAHGIFYLLACGVLSRIRRCHCGLRSFAPQEQSISHSRLCSKRLFDQSPEQKQKRKKQNAHNYRVRTGKHQLEHRGA